jgi:hypothetical protein
MKPHGNGGSSEGPVLPAWRAFVVQFSRQTEPATHSLSGRIEHLSSGRRAHFESPEELLEALCRLLEELGKEEA